MAGIYLHIPFCKQACSYCDFYFVTRTALRPEYVQALLAEIRSWKGRPEAEQEVETLYLGGGTPSQLHVVELEQIFQALRDTFRFTGREVTMELNPDDVKREYLRELKTLGVTRASMGVQSFQEERLQFMNRAHTVADAHRALELLQSEAFESYTVDLIYGSPGDTLQGLERDLDQLLSYNPPHISAYSLTIEPRTRLGRQLELGRLQPADEEEVALQMRAIRDRLQDKGLYRYEVSNFSKPGCEAIHNRRYWDHTPYLGFGPSAHSFWLDSKGGWRWTNPPDLKSYLRQWAGAEKKDPREDLSAGSHWPQAPERLTPFQLAEERIMLGLRTREGISSEELECRYGYQLHPSQNEWIETKREEGLILGANDRIALTEDGLTIADHLIVELLHRQGR